MQKRRLIVGFLTCDALFYNKRFLSLSQHLIPVQVYLAAWPLDSVNVKTLVTLIRAQEMFFLTFYITILPQYQSQ